MLRPFSCHLQCPIRGQVVRVAHRERTKAMQESPGMTNESVSLAWLRLRCVLFVKYICYINCKSHQAAEVWRKRKEQKTQRTSKIVRSWTLQICITLVPVLWVGPGHAKNRIPRSGLGQTGRARMAQINLETLRDDLDSCCLHTLGPCLESAASVFRRGHSFWQVMNHCYGTGIAALTALNKLLVFQHQFPVRQDVLRFGYDGLGRPLSVHLCLWI